MAKEQKCFILTVFGAYDWVPQITKLYTWGAVRLFSSTCTKLYFFALVTTPTNKPVTMWGHSGPTKIFVPPEFCCAQKIFY